MVHISEFDTQMRAIDALASELAVEVNFHEVKPRDNLRFDGMVSIQAPINLDLLIETRLWHLSGHNKTASMMAQELKRYGDDVVLVTDYVTEHKAKALREHGIEFFDVAGNIYINRPGFYIWVTGNKYPGWERPEIRDTSAAFERTGLKVTFALITHPDLINTPYRTIAKASGVALGTVKRVLDSLEHSKNLFTPKKQRKLQVNKELINNWAQAYINKLQPKLRLGEFVTENEIHLENLDYFTGAACVGGEVAAEYFSDMLKPKSKTIYIEEKIQSEFMSKFRLKRSSPYIADPDVAPVQLFTKFWQGYDQHTNYAHPLVVYADLLATNNPRNTEAAEVIYEKHLEPLCR